MYWLLPGCWQAEQATPAAGPLSARQRRGGIVTAARALSAARAGCLSEAGASRLFWQRGACAAAESAGGPG